MNNEETRTQAEQDAAKLLANYIKRRQEAEALKGLNPLQQSAEKAKEPSPLQQSAVRWPPRWH